MVLERSILKVKFGNSQIVVFRDFVAMRRHWFYIFINYLMFPNVRSY